jgi:hypothetical protein
LRDPYVVELTYRLFASPGVEYLSPPPVEWERPTCFLRLADGQLTANLKVRCRTVDEARRLVEAELKTWEAWASVTGGRDDLRFDFIDSRVEDFSPNASGDQAIFLNTLPSTSKLFPPIVTLTVQRREYPQPPKEFVRSPDVESLLDRYSRYRAGGEPLPAMAYFCLTLLESKAARLKAPGKNTRTAAAAWSGISSSILSKLAELATEVGSPMDARKADVSRGLPSRSLTTRERMDGVGNSPDDSPRRRIGWRRADGSADYDERFATIIVVLPIGRACQPSAPRTLGISSALEIATTYRSASFTVQSSR